MSTEAKLEVGEVAFLEVTANTEIGAFVDWGLPKELLVPFAEQTTEPRIGDRYAIGLYRDETGRFVGTMKVSEMLDRKPRQWVFDEWVVGEAWRNEPDIGIFVIIERAFLGLLPASEPNQLSRGELAKFRVSAILPDGKIELSLRGLAHEEIGADAARILAALKGPNSPSIGDKASPEEIRDLFALSKKAFKRAVGRLLKDGAVTIDDAGNVIPRR